MAEKKKQKKGVPIFPILVAVIVIVVLGIIIYNVVNKEPEVAEDGTLVNQYAAKAKDADDIKINDNDSNDVKIEKIQGKLELLNKEIDEKQSQMDEENKELNKLYEEYVNIMNESQTGVPAEQSTQATETTETTETPANETAEATE